MEKFRWTGKGLASIAPSCLALACSQGLTSGKGKNCAPRDAQPKGQTLSLSVSGAPSPSSRAAPVPGSVASFGVTGDPRATSVDASSPLSGGYLDIKVDVASPILANAENKVLKANPTPRCAVALRFNDENGTLGAEVTTAGHCFKGMFGLVQDLKLSVFDPGLRGYFPPVQVFSPFLEGRKKAIAALEAAGFSPESVDVLRYEMAPGLLGIGGVGDFDIVSACAKQPKLLSATSPPLFSEPGTHTLCYSGSDLIKFDIQFDAPDGSVRPDAELAAFIRARVAAQAGAEAVMKDTPAFKASAELHRLQKLNAQYQLERGVGDYIDYFRVGCAVQTFEEMGGDDFLNSFEAPIGKQRMFAIPRAGFNDIRKRMVEICQRSSDFKIIFKAHMRFMGRTMDELETVFTPPDPVRSIVSRYALESFAGREGASMRPWFNALFEELKKDPSKLRTHFNVSSPDGTSTAFASAFLKGLSSAQDASLTWPTSEDVYPSVKWDTLFVQVPAASKAFDFAVGDSGSVISWNDSHPVLVLAAVDGKPSSGGASVINLPVRRQRPSEAGAGAQAECD